MITEDRAIEGMKAARKVEHMLHKKGMTTTFEDGFVCGMQYSDDHPESSEKLVNIDKMCRWLDNNVHRYMTTIRDKNGQPAYAGFNKTTFLNDLRKALKPSALDNSK